MRATPSTRTHAARRCHVLRLMLTAALLGLTASLTTEPSTKWVIMEGDEDATKNWVLAEMQMFADEACTEPFTVQRSIYDSCNEESPGCDASLDATGNSAGAEPAALAALYDNDTPEPLGCSVAQNGTFSPAPSANAVPHFIGYQFTEPVVPKCVAVSQASCALKKVTDVCVAAWRPENVTEPYGTWEVVGTLQLTGSDSGVIANFTSLGDNTAHCNTTQALPDVVRPIEVRYASEKKGMSTENVTILVSCLSIGSVLIIFMGVWYWRHTSQDPALPGAAETAVPSSP